MDSQVLIAIISAVATILGAWIANRPKRAEQSAAAVTVPASVVPSAPPMAVSPTQVEFGRVLRDIGIVQLVANMGTAIFGFAMGLDGAPVGSSAFIIGILFLGLLLGGIGFFISGLLTEPAKRWRHLMHVAIGVVIATLVLNSLLLGTPITALVIAVALIQTSIAMGAGGALAGVVKR